MMELLYNKWIILGLVAVIGLVVYRILNKKDAAMSALEKEYFEILNSDKYKVKGQYD